MHGADRLLAALRGELSAIVRPSGVPTSLVARGRVADVDVSTYRAAADGGADVTLRLFHGSGSGTACVFVPGRFATSAVFTADQNRDVRLYLAGHGVDVYSVEHGGKPGSGPEDFSWGTAACVARLMTALAAAGERALVLIGHSMGAFLAYLAATRCPGSVQGIAALDGGVVSPSRGDLSDLEATAGDLLAGTAGRETVSAKPSVLAGLTERVIAGDARAQRALGRLLTLPSPDRGGRMLGSGHDPAVVYAAAAYLAACTAVWSRRQTLEARLLALYGPSSWADDDIGLLADRGIRVFAALGTASGPGRLRRNEYTARLADPQATVIIRPEYAHLDVLLGPDVHARVFEPLLGWLLAARATA